MKSQAKRVEVPGPYELARECLESARGDRERAARDMRSRVTGDVILVPALLEIACNFCVAQIRASDNNTSWTNGASRAVPQEQRGARVLALARDTERALMDIVLPNGVVIADARGADFDDAIDLYQKRIRTETHKVRWFQLIRNRIGNQTVSRALKEADLKRLREEAEDA